MPDKELTIISNPVNSYTPGRSEKIRYGVVHFVSARYYEGYENDPYNMEGILKLFEELGAKHQFSCHDIIDREGNIYTLVNIKDTAWGVGNSVISIPDYKVNLNSCTLSIELVCKQEDKYTAKQYKALAKLAVLREDQIVNRGYGEIEHWVGHDWISGEIAVKLGIKEKASIKVDPGKNFDWDMFLREKYRVRLKQDILIDVHGELKSKVKNEIISEFKQSLSISDTVSLFINKILKRKSK